MKHAETEIERLTAALHGAEGMLQRFSRKLLNVEEKANGDPVTEADLAVDAYLREALLRPGEGWLSEETRDDLDRLRCRCVWVVDPLDGTKEFIAGIPEWCVSVGWVVDGAAAAGGICNPATSETLIGGPRPAPMLGQQQARVSQRDSLDGAVVLASRSELRRGDWEIFRPARFEIRPTGSIAYKLARVAAGRADATVSLAPKHEWDIAAGVALVQSARGMVTDLDGEQIRFNRPVPWVNGLIAAGPSLHALLLTLVREARAQGKQGV